MHTNLRRVHFITPPARGKPIERIFGCNYAFFLQHNIFILYPATLLKGRGIDVKVTDAPIDGFKRVEDIVDDSDVYVFYSNFLSRKVDLEAAETITRIEGEKIMIFMGSDPTWDPEAYIKDNNYYVIRGEPELVLLELLRGIEKENIENVCGISFMKNSRVIHNPTAKIIGNLDDLPYPERKLYKNPYKYINPKFRRGPCTTILTSRGCPYRCLYCVPNSLSFAREVEYKRFFGKKPPVKFRSAENVINEFIKIAGEGYRAVQIVDDEFTLNKERTIRICEGIKDLNIEVGCLARADHLTDEILVSKLAEAGVMHIDIGVESFCQKILDSVRKDLKIEDFFKAYANLKNYNIEPEINILIGASPIETKETIEYTLRITLKLDPEILHVQICTPFPGTEFYEIAKREKYFTAGDYIPVDPMREAIISYPQLSKEEMEKFLRVFQRKFYLRPKYLVKRLIKTRSLKQLAAEIVTMWRMLAC